MKCIYCRQEFDKIREYNRAYNTHEENIPQHVNEVQHLSCGAWNQLKGENKIDS